MDTKLAKAAAPGFGGNITVSLEMEGDRIISCTAEGPGENSFKAHTALSQIPASIVEHNSCTVDAVSGATVTSDAIMRGAKIAYDNLTGNSSDVHMKPGKYTAGAMGYLGVWELPVTITVNDSALLKIELPEDRFAHGETEVILKSSLFLLPALCSPLKLPLRT